MHFFLNLIFSFARSPYIHTNQIMPHFVNSNFVFSHGKDLLTDLLLLGGDEFSCMYVCMYVYLVRNELVKINTVAMSQHS